MFKKRKLETALKTAKYGLDVFQRECGKLAMENLVQKAERDRAVDAAVALENEVGRLKEENKALTGLIESLRWRIFTLLRSTDVDAEVFGLPKYVLDVHEEDMIEPDWIEAYQEMLNMYKYKEDRNDAQAKTGRED